MAAFLGRKVSYLGLLRLWAIIDRQQLQDKQNTLESKHATQRIIYKSHCPNQYSYMLINICFIGRTSQFCIFFNIWSYLW